MKSHNNEGFTLIEVLISSFIVGLLLSAIFFTISFLNINIQSSNKNYKEKEKFLISLSMIERDLKTLVNRPIRDSFGDYEAALIIDNDSEKKISLSRILYNDVTNINEILRIDYVFSNNKLKRNIWNVLDRVQNTEYQTHFLDNNIKDIQILAIDQTNKWLKFWPISSISSDKSDNNNAESNYENNFGNKLLNYQNIMSGDTISILPYAFKIIVNHKNYGTIERVILSQI